MLESCKFCGSDDLDGMRCVVCGTDHPDDVLHEKDEDAVLYNLLANSGMHVVGPNWMRTDGEAM